MHLRRALLLFAIVLGLAALAATLSRTPRDEQRTSDSPSVAAPPPGAAESPRAPIRFGAERPATRRLEAGRAATVSVAVAEPGQVEIPALGLSSPAERLTPARFDVLEQESGRYAIVFIPADDDEPRPAGTLVVR